MKLTCPEDSCQNQTFYKDGHYFRKSDSKYIQRYRCKLCGRRTSSARTSPCFGQNKRTVNHLIEALFCSKVSNRRIAKILNIDKKTVHRKLIFLGLRARIFNQKFLKNYYQDRAQSIQIDDLITKEKTKLKPLSISGAVDPQTRYILSLKVSQIPAFGHLAHLSRQKYGKRRSHHKIALEKMFEDIYQLVHQEAKILSDEHKYYPEFVKRFFPKAEHLQFKSIKSSVAGQGELKKSRRDPLFAINHSFAMLRDNINRLVRRSWCVTQSQEMLQLHLDIYIKFHNSKLV